MMTPIPFLGLATSFVFAVFPLAAASKEQEDFHPAVLERSLVSTISQDLVDE